MDKLYNIKNKLETTNSKIYHIMETLSILVLNMADYNKTETIDCLSTIIDYGKELALQQDNLLTTLKN